MKRICLYSPYFPGHFGGGEKHLLDVARVLATQYEVYIGLSSGQTEHSADQIRQQYADFFGYPLEMLQFCDTPLGTGAPLLSKLRWTRQWDALYSVTDGSFFLSAAKHNFLHIQIPFTNSLSLFEFCKLKTWKHLNTNSEFTRSVIETSWGVRVQDVLYPMVNTAEFSPSTQKDRLIIGVGRFFTQLHSKRQDILIQAFAKLFAQAPDWKLVLIGSVEDRKFLARLQSQASRFPITFVLHPNRETLIKYMNRASFFWHAAGFGVDQELHPERVEHFGISTLEAMAAGAIPVVHGKGGQIEVLGSSLSTLLWDSPEACAAKTLELIRTDDLAPIREQVVQRANQFVYAAFKQRVLTLFSGV